MATSAAALFSKAYAWMDFDGINDDLYAVRSNAQYCYQLTSICGQSVGCGGGAVFWVAPAPAPVS
jgi:hypothetical protein